MKKAMAFLLAAGMLVCFAACGGTADNTTGSTPPAETTGTTVGTGETTGSPAETTGTPVETTKPPVVVELPKDFDPSNIVFSFGAISDIHIGNSTTDVSAQKMESALRQLAAEAKKDDPNGLAAVLSAGDLIDGGGYGGKFSQMKNFRTIYERVFSPKDVPLVFAPGNHDVEWTPSSVFNVDMLNDYLSDDYFLVDVDKQALEDEGNRHSVVNGYHVISLVPSNKDPVFYTQATKDWLDATLAKITAENPNQFVIVLNHAMIKDTVYGSDLGTFWYTSDLTDILSKYNQVVIFGGHLHFPLNDPRSIMQTAFTSVGCGSVNYMAIESGKYEDMASATTMNDRNDISSGNLVQIDKNGNMRIRRMDFSNSEVIGNEDWTVSHPTADGSHLQKYTKARGNAENNTAPVLSSVDVELGKASGTRVAAKLKFAAGTDDEFVHHYEVTFGKKDGTKRTIKLLADFYRNAKPADMKKEWTRDIGTFEIGTTYEVTVTAYDSWDAVSNTVKKEITPEGSGTVEPGTENGIYADIDIVDGRLVDSKGKLKIENMGGLCMEASVTVNGKSAKVPAFCVTKKGSYGLCTFTEFTNTAAMQEFVEGGFSVEAFYVMGQKGAAQGIVCGTQDGGWGLAEDKNGKPYFITGKTGSSSYNAGAYATKAASNAELVHVVGVYDFEAKKEMIYINGTLAATQKIEGDYKNGASNAFNKFCLGADIQTTGRGGDYLSPNMTLVDAKIYKGAIGADEVKTAYDNAVASIK